MAFNWAKYLELAIFLQDPQNNLHQEAAYRSAVSRAYYAAYHYVLDYATKKLNFNPVNTRDDQQALINYLKNHRHCSIGMTLSDLKLWRNQCDYDNCVENLNQITTKAITNSQKVFNTLK